MFGFGKKVGPTLGLDINSSSISLIQIEKTKTELRVSRFASMPTPPDIVREGLFTDPEAVGSAVRELLDSIGLPAKKPLPLINFAIPGQAVVIRLMPVPVGMPTEELDDVVQQEALNNLPFALNEANLDYCLLPQTERTDPDGVRRVDVLLAAIQRVYVESYVRMAEAADCTLNRLDISPLAIIRALAGADFISDDGRLTMAVNIRNDATDITLIRRGMPLFSRSVLLGVEAIGEAISRSIDAPIDEAIALLPQLDLSAVAAYDPKVGQAAQVTRSIMGDLTAEVGRSLEFYMSQVGIVQVDQIILSGAACLIPGLEEFISNRLNIETLVCDPFENLAYDEEEIPDDRKASYTMLVGLVSPDTAGELETVQLDLNKDDQIYDFDRTGIGNDEDATEEEADTPWFMPSLLVGVVSAVVAIGTWGAFALYLNGAQDIEAAQVDEQITTEKAQVDQMTKQQEEVGLLRQKQDILNRIVNHGTPRSVILQTMKNGVPEGVQLTSLDLVENNFKAAGQSVNFTKASHYAINLQGSNMLDDCRISNVHRLKAAPQIVGFELTATIKPEAATTPLAAVEPPVVMNAAGTAGTVGTR